VNLFDDENDFEEIPLTQSAPAAKRLKTSAMTFKVPSNKKEEGILSALHMTAMTTKLRQEAAQELTSLKTTKFPQITLGGGKTFAASYSMELGKSVFHFEAVQKETHVEILLSELGMDTLMNNASVFITFIKKLEEAKQNNQNVEPEIPQAVTLEKIERDGQKYGITLSAFRFTQGPGCCVSIKETNEANKKEYKQWLMSGTNFVYFTLIHVPFFSTFYERYLGMIDDLRQDEGLTAYDGAVVGSWKKQQSVHA
jgi:hypothetical protein